jgi:glycosyltransferase involved in cell wall biosynthesis
MKRVLIFSLVYYPDVVGGAEVAIKEITDRISSADIEFDMITLRLDSTLPRYEKIGNVNIHRIGFGTKKPSISDFLVFPLVANKYLFPFLGFLKARSLHNRNPYDGIWAMMANYAAFAALFFKTWFPKVPYLLTLQEGDPIEYIKQRVANVYALFEKIFTKADFVQTISNYLAEFARSMGYVGQLEVIPNGASVAHFSKNYSTEELFLLKQKLAKAADDIFLITTSRLVKKNATEEVIRALPLLDARVTFLILGIGPDEVMLRALAEELKVNDRVKFLRQIGHDEMPKYLQVSDIFIRPSRSEGLGISFIEAMAAGIPVIATPVGGIPDFLFDPDKNFDQKPTGLFCEVDDPQSIAKQVRRLITDTNLRDQLIVNAKKLVTEKYDWNLIAKDMKEKVFDIILSN